MIGYSRGLWCSKIGSMSALWTKISVHFITSEYQEDYQTNFVSDFCSNSQDLVIKLCMLTHVHKGWSKEAIHFCNHDLFID